MKRRLFLKFIGLSPATPVLAKVAPLLPVLTPAVVAPLVVTMDELMAARMARMAKELKRDMEWALINAERNNG